MMTQNCVGQIHVFKAKRKIALCFATTTRARTRGMDANVVLMLKIPIELQRDYSGGLLLQIA